MSVIFKNFPGHISILFFRGFHGKLAISGGPLWAFGVGAPGSARFIQCYIQSAKENFNFYLVYEVPCIFCCLNVVLTEVTIQNDLALKSRASGLNLNLK